MHGRVLWISQQESGLHGRGLMQSKTPGTASGGAHTIGGWSGPTPFCFGGGDAAIPPSHSSQNDMPSNRQLSNSIGRKRCPAAINACPSGANEATHLCSRHNATHHIKKRLFANNAQKQQQQQQLVEKDMQKHQSSALQTSAGAMISGIPLLQGSQNQLTAVTGQEYPPGLIASRTVHVVSSPTGKANGPTSASWKTRCPVIAQLAQNRCAAPCASYIVVAIPAWCCVEIGMPSETVVALVPAA